MKEYLEDFINCKYSKYSKYFFTVENYLLNLKFGEDIESKMNFFKENRIVSEENHYPYTKIKMIDLSSSKFLKLGDNIQISEKIDGANCYLQRLDFNEFVACSRKTITCEKNHNQGFYFWALDNFKKIPKKYYNLRFYGEWLAPHHCVYPIEKYAKFYIFDIMDNGKYLYQKDVRNICNEIGLDYVPIFYEGPFIGYEHIMSFVGKTLLGGEKGEGIVIKNQTKLNKAGVISHVKIVSEEFQETNPLRKEIKTVDLNSLKDSLEKYNLIKKEIESIFTFNRLRKIYLNLINLKNIPVDWKKYPQYIKYVNKTIYSEMLKDIKSEEFEKYNEIISLKNGKKIFLEISKELIEDYLKKIEEEIF